MHLEAIVDLVLKALRGTPHAAMAALPGAWQALSQQFAGLAAGLALTALWQGAAIALGLVLCLHLAPRSSAAHRFALWAAGFGALVGLQLLPLLAPFAGISAPAASAGAAPAASHPWLQLDLRWSVVIAALWFTASLFRAIDLALHALSLRKLWKSAVPVALDAAAPLAVRSRRPVEICTTTALERPSVIGFFSPRILIPDWLFARLTPGELNQIVLHELEHLRRGDDWTNLLQKICLVLFPLNPALAFIERRLCREREMACDDGVIRVTHAPRAYAACLASLAERGLERNVVRNLARGLARSLARRADALSLGAWQRRPELVRRVHSILRRQHGLSPAATRAVLGAVGCVLVFGSVELASCPRLVAFAPAHDAALAHAASTPAREPGDRAATHASLANAGPDLRAAVAPVRSHPQRCGALRASLRRPAFARRRSGGELALAMDREPPMEASAQAVPSHAVLRQSLVVFTGMGQVEVYSFAAAAAAEQSASAAHSSALARPSAPTRQSVSARQPKTRAQRSLPITLTRIFVGICPTNSSGEWLVIQL